MIALISTCKDLLSEKEFVDPIEQLIPMKCLRVHYRDFNLQGDLSGIIICGTALADNQYLNDLEDFEWIIKTHIPILAICAGMQVLVLQSGGSLEKGGKIGWHPLKKPPSNILVHKSLSAYFLHSQKVNSVGNLETLIEDREGPQIVRHRSNHQYGLMFHPEVRNTSIIDNFISITL